MTWAKKRTGDAKYRSPQHRAYTAALKGQLARDGALICQAARCVMTSRYITNPNGSARDGLTAGHMPDGVTYNGPEHRACNIREAAVRANRRSKGKRDGHRRWVV